MVCSESRRLDAAMRSVACRPQSRIAACPTHLYSSPQHTLTARIVKPACTAAADLNVKHRTPQLGGWYAQRAVGSTLRRGLSPAYRNHASQPARPGCCTAHTLTARIVKLARTAATDLNTKHHTPQVGGWGALRAVGSTLRRSLSPADRKHASQPARPGVQPMAHADGTDRKTCSHGSGRPQC